MNPFIHQGNKYYPSIELNAQKGSMSFGGMSIPANADDFFDPIIAWMIAYSENPKNQTQIRFTFDYFSTSTTMKLWNVLKVLSNLNEKGNSAVAVDWYFDKDDDRMKETGEEFESLSGLKFNLIPR
jgi:hypothetical protein